MNPGQVFGHLFHARGRHQSTSGPLDIGVSQLETHFEVKPINTNFGDIEHYMDHICLDNTDISHAHLYTVCINVSHARPFNANRNCQEWVLEVLRAMIRECRNGEVTNSIFKEMKLQGFITTRDKVIDTSVVSSAVVTSSWPLSFWNKR